MRTNAIRLLAVGAAVAVAATACSPAPDAGEDERLRVVATTTQVGSVVREIGGDAIDLTVLLEAGVEAHDFELTPSHGAALEQADLILVSGVGLEEWLESSLETIGATEQVRDLSDGVDLRDPRASEPHGHEDEGGDAHEDAVDPHYWLSAPNAIVMVGNARDALAAAAPDQADAFADRASALVARLEAADAEVRSLIGEVPEDRRKIVTDHDALGYFVDEYGLDFVGSVFPSLDVSSEPSAQEIEALVAEIRASGVTAIFTESSVNPRLASAVADETDARLIDEPVYTDSLGPAGSGADTIDGMLVHNARVIRDGLLGG
jgi:zinc/manganese transport system substrate-binding protein